MYYVALSAGFLCPVRPGYRWTIGIREADCFTTWEAADEAGRSSGSPFWAVVKA